MLKSIAKLAISDLWELQFITPPSTHSKLIMPREGMKLIDPERSRIVGCRSPRGDEAWLSVNGEQRRRSSSTFLRSRRKRPHRRSALNRSQIVVLADV